MSDHGSDHSQGALPRQVIRLADPVPRLDTPFEIIASPAEATALAGVLGINGVRKLRLTGKLIPVGRNDWHLKAKLGATVTQPCVISLAPVTTRIDEEIERRYLSHLPEIEGGEEEMLDDDIEALPVTLDLWEVLAESLSLALPPWPRAEGVELGEVVVTEPGALPLDSDGARAFAGLAQLRDKLTKKDDETE